MTYKPPSLRWRLVRGLAAAQTAMIALAGVVIFVLVIQATMEFPNGNLTYELQTLETLTRSVAHDRTGRLYMRPSADMSELRAKSTTLWFIVTDKHGQRLVEGTPPAAIRPALSALPLVESASFDVGGASTTDTRASVAWVESDAGQVQIAFWARGPVSTWELLRLASPVLWQTLLIIALVSVSTMLVMPLAVKRGLKGLDKAAQEARSIDFHRTGMRLGLDQVPAEVAPFVQAINDALARLDTALAKHKRFIADAAHELRTPVAILTTRLSALPASPLRTRLMEDAVRLGALTGQLLDIQRLDSDTIVFSRLNLATIAERVVLDLAPLAFAAGYQVAFETDAAVVPVDGDEVSIERALTNLIQNAISYGGRQGTITIRVSAAGTVDVADEGRGVKDSERERIFEAFHRDSKDGRGAGLGLDLVQTIMRHHGGSVLLVPDTAAGACFRLVFPAAV
ncbi:HAMP domain-containing sensor histidine kinase [Xanthomonas nasturtii]|uniref:sensor histidine kinase n=1 Tax=Xanthomonas TaxID=338 RepID=UPI002B227937|nr:HAMP domain-containing sensor histidine kinase [Xanthomonas nasturtii]MEA9554491.1 HAMP domain-containing sensor histidine kinase [Xanthomonas nasturtii]